MPAQRALVADTLRGHYEAEARQRKAEAARQVGLANRKSPDDSGNVATIIDSVSVTGDTVTR